MIVGIIGKPNTGKSTFFNAATLSHAQVASYPFTTIKPNVGIAYLRVSCVCKELDVKDSPVNSICINGIRLIPVKLIDVAGLVPDAWKGRGLGNKFLDDIRRADALIHVIDASGSTDEEGRPCTLGAHDPLCDVDFVEREFDLWLLQIVKRDWPRMSRTAESGVQKISSMLAERLSGLSITEEQIVESMNSIKLNFEKPTNWSEEDVFDLCRVIRQISKPMVIAMNKSDLLTSLKNIERLRAKGCLVIPCAAEAELLLRRAAEKELIEYIPGDSSFHMLHLDRLTPEQKKAFNLVNDRVLKVWSSTGVQQVINTVYFDLMKSIVVYPVEDEKRLSDKTGHVLPDAYVMKVGSKAKDLAYKIHTDLGKGFLYAVDAKKGVRLGADYVLKDRDVIKIVSTTKRG
ncbi:MAG: redox-regulated ATPase YchF [Candidatus Methylarchaceae archaeon HK02M1]|nr:redox-regulated ATPase YchF [Candidatus Methylarchaceae archaeon HK02M1]